MGCVADTFDTARSRTFRRVCEAHVSSPTPSHRSLDMSRVSKRTSGPTWAGRLGR
jgi:hypothetical protein